MISNSKQNRQKYQNSEKRKTSFRQKIRTQKDEKLVFLKKQVDNGDLCKSVLNKIMTKQEECIKFNIVAPLKTALLNVFHQRYFHC